MHSSTRRGQSVGPSSKRFDSIPDLVRRMQTLETAPNSNRPSIVSVVRSSISQSGLRSLYAGLTASLMRQMSYSLVRLGSYEKMKEHLSRDGKPSTLKLLLAASFAGGLGGVAGNPAGTFYPRLVIVVKYQCLTLDLRHHSCSHD